MDSSAPADRRREKRAAARAAVGEVSEGMIVGIGTGSTVAFAIEALAERCRQGLRITAVATSLETASLAARSGIDIRDFSALSMVDLCIDGVDEIDPAFRAIKGAGGAMLREKIVAQAARRMVAIADSRKRVDRLGMAPLPIEILAFARGTVADRLEKLGGTPTVRRTSAGDIFQTDQGNPVLDCAFGPFPAPEELDRALSRIPGVVGTGLFLGEIDALYLGRGDCAEKHERKASPS